MSVSFLNVETEDAFASLLELAANNDLEGFKRFIDHEPSSVDEVGLWYGRQNGSSQMVLQHLTPLMVAATYGSFDVLKLIVSLPEVDVNRNCGVDNSTALHCAASGGSVNAIDVVKLLLAAGADPNLTDANGRRPFDVIIVSPKLQTMKYSLQMMLTMGTSFEEEHHLRVSLGSSNLDSPLLSPSHANGSPCSPDLTPSLEDMKSNGLSASLAPEKKEYPIDPSLPDIKNSIYSTDEFRMFSFKVRPCSRAYSHDWTECPFVHPGENARRRDPRKYHYSCVPCPDFRKGACRRGDMCEYAHGVFECWLHPAQYRTRLCKDGTSCNRRVCFFAHTQEELRPLYVSTGSAVPSPRSNASAANAMDFAAAMSLLPGSPSSVPVMSPSPFTPPMSPSANGISNQGWASQQNVPALHLPGSNFQSSRLRSSLNARDIPLDDFNVFGDIDIQQQQLLNELPLLSQQSISTNMLNRSVRPKTLTPSNLEDIFSAESSSPRYSDPALAAAVFSPTHKSAVLNQFQQQQQSMLSPIKTTFSPRNVDHSLLQAPFGVSSSGRMSPRAVEPISPMSARVSMLARQEKHHQQFRSLSSRDLGSNAAAAVASLEETWSKWGSPNGQPEWAVTGDDFGKHKRSSSFELLNNGEEPDLSWVHSLVKESPQDIKEKSAPRVSGASGTATSSGEGANLNNQIEQVDQSVLGAWLEQMQLDQLMAQ
ncbi:CCCH-type zinc finger protein with ARM repeat domain-containing protein [Perilla frutescens var. hirtella]|nr:CCCH-type zinc finger protein with ARM repeat domain-containing protein [Perilla frutescens var. frutescens]KAH6793881.1 CCCH-type zinc finger protein with ARM repeat domain-containing protein [Perilla frutescens var. hirtella]